jgi:DNA polymerase
MRRLHKNLRSLSSTERKVLFLDAVVNDRGIALDRKAAELAQKIADEWRARLSREICVLTHDAVTSPSQTGKLRQWLFEQGFPVPNIDGQQLQSLLKMDLPPEVRRVVEIRAEAAKTSVSKLATLLARCSPDGRLRDNLTYHGASTGRWTASGAQLHNLPRPATLAELGPNPIEASRVIADIADGHDADLIDIIWGPPLSVISQCLRGMLVASEGHELFVADFNAIEARVLAWLAGQDDLVELFRTGGDPYRALASVIYNVNADDIAKNSRERQVGKQSVLGAGYQMGWRKFQASLAQKGIVIDDELARHTIKTYRAKNDAIRQFWRDLEQAALSAVGNPGKICEAGAHRVKFVVRDNILWMRLPSGRRLAYCNPHLCERAFEYEDDDGEIVIGTKTVVAYWAQDAKKVWSLRYGYGGLWCENAVQATARDLLAEAMLRLEESGYRIVLTVHDEIVAEVPAGAGDVGEFETIMAMAPGWAEGCPIKAEGWRGTRYR